MSAPARTGLPARRRELLGFYAQGYTYAQISERINYSSGYLQATIRPYLTPEIRQLHRQNYRGKPRGSRSHSQADGVSARALRMLDLFVHKGYNYTEIGRIYGITRQAVEQQLKPVLTPADQRLAKKRRQRRRYDRQAAELARLRPDFVALIQAGCTQAEIRQRLGIGDAALRRLLAGLDKATRVQWASEARSSHDLYSRAEKLAVLQEAAAQSGGRIGIRRFEQLRRSHPHWPAAAIYQILGWNYWKKEAGLPTNPRPPALGQRRFSEADCREAAELVAAILGRPYSDKEYDCLRRSSDPCAATFRNRFGKGRWTAALKHLVPSLFEIRRRYPPPMTSP